MNGEDEVVFWFEHDLYDQLLLIRHLWWIDTQGRGRADRYSIVIGTDYLGLLKPQDFPPRFERRQAITEEQIALGTARVDGVLCRRSGQAGGVFASPA